MIFFQKFFLILFHTTKLQYKTPSKFNMQIVETIIIDLIWDLQILWEPYLKMNTSTITFPDNIVDFPQV